MGRMATKCGASESCSLAVDVILQSSDGEQFGAHSKNLELHSDAFPVAGSTIPPDGDIVELTESAQILRLLLCFTHNMPPPDLTSLDLQTLLMFGETVSLKYGMQYASQWASQEVNRRIDAHPLEILAYKTKVSDLSMIDEVARRTMNLPVENVVAVLVNLEAFRTWVRYREKWQSVLALYRQALNGYSIQSYQGHGSLPGYNSLKKDLAQTSDYIGLPSRTTAQSAIAILAQACSDATHYHSDDIDKQAVINRLCGIVDQLPLWKNFL